MKLVIFDCDGVLLNSKENMEKAEQAAFAEIGLNLPLTYIKENFSCLSFENHKRRSAEIYHAHMGQPMPEAFWQRRTAIYMERESAELRALPGIMQLLTDLKNAGVAVCIATNNDMPNLVRKLKTGGLSDIFQSSLFTRDQVQRHKPFPDIYLRAAEQMQITNLEDCVVVEDSVPGVHAGVAAGMNVIGLVMHENPQPDDFKRLLDAGAMATVDSVSALRKKLSALGILPAGFNIGSTMKTPAPVAAL